MLFDKFNMALERIEEKISGNVFCTIDSFDDEIVEVIDFNKIFLRYQEHFTGNNFNCVFFLDSLTIAYKCPSLIKAEIPSIPATASQSQRRAQELEYQSTHNYSNNYAAELSFYYTFLESQTQLFFSSALLYNTGNRAYLPLIVPYLSDVVPLQANKNLKISCSARMKPQETPADHAEIFGFYSGLVSYDFDTGVQQHQFIF